MNKVSKLYTIAFNYLEQKNFNKALKCYIELLNHYPSFPPIWFDLAYLYLVQKDFTTGFKIYEKRLELTQHTINQTNFNYNLWKNESLIDKTLLIFVEQGFGDTIQFIRFIKPFSKKYPNTKIKIYVQQDLQKLLKFNFPEFLFVDSLENQECDFAIPLMSLPFKLKLDFIEPKKSYLNVKNKRKNNKVQKIGICWQGNLFNSRDKLRSIDFNLLLSTLPTKNVQLYSLQKDIRINDKNIIDLGKKFNNFYDTAKAIKNLDLVITVDTSIAHLSGALGTKTYLLLPYLPDWRWSLEGSKSYWYYNTFIFRQKEKLNWTKPLLELKNAIAKNLSSDFISDIQNALFHQQCKNFKLSNYYFKEALKKNRNFAEGHLGLGNNLIELKKYNSAIKIFNKAIQLNNNIFEAYYNIANIYIEKKHFKKAIKYFKKALLIEPNHIQSLHNLGGIYQKLESLPKAHKYYKKAFYLDPNSTNILESLASYYKDIGNLNNSIKYYKKAIDLNSTSEYLHTNLGISMIMNGDFQNGWKEYENRWNTKDFKALISKYKGKLWSNENLNGKTLLIFTEQGFGDTIQFVRLIKNIKILYPSSTIQLQCHKSLKKLFKTISFIDNVLSIEDKLNQYDYFISLMSLPHVLKLKFKDIPSSTPYIFPKNKKKNSTNNKYKKIGIFWNGSNSFNNSKRSVKLSNFSILLKNKNFKFYSLQIGKPRQELNINSHKIKDLGKNIKDFYDTAQAIQSLDLIITIDTSVAHLSGALNKPTWVIIPNKPGYLWMLNRNDSPWYPTMKLFRQKKSNNWNKVFKSIKYELGYYFEDKKKD